MGGNPGVQQVEIWLQKVNLTSMAHPTDATGTQKHRLDQSVPETINIRAIEARNRDAAKPQNPTHLPLNATSEADEQNRHVRRQIKGGKIIRQRDLDTRGAFIV